MFPLRIRRAGLCKCEALKDTLTSHWIIAKLLHAWRGKGKRAAEAAQRAREQAGRERHRAGSGQRRPLIVMNFSIFPHAAGAQGGEWSRGSA